MTTASIFSAAPAYPAAGPGAGDEYSIVIARSTPTLVVIAGPTGVGKSALALDLAERLGFEIICADSRQVYRRLEIGTAKPSLRDRARAPHHLVDYVEPDEPYSVARFRADGDRLLADLAGRSAGALLVGGTGHYIQALVDRIEPPAVEPQADVRAELEALARSEGPAAVHARLALVDGEAARSIPATNVRRVIRALEVTLVTGRPFSEVGRRRSEPLPALRVVLTMPRQMLYQRVDERVDRMVATGWLEEVRSLLDAGYDPRLPALSSTGYRELTSYLGGTLAWDEAVRRIKWATHAYVRRQYVWLRRQHGYRWIEVDSAGYAQAAALVEGYVARGDGTN